MIGNTYPFTVFRAQQSLTFSCIIAPFTTPTAVNPLS